jgi:hypothetical protein
MNMRGLVLLAALASSSCAIPLKGLMRPSAAPLNLTSSPTTARVIFARPPSFFGSAVVPTFIDPQRRTVFGQTPNDSYFAVDLEPGVYQVCPTMMAFDSAMARQQNMTDHDWFELGLRMPITELHVAAGNTYLLRISLSWGPRVRVIPIIPGSADEEKLLAALPGVRPAEVVTPAKEHETIADEEALEAFYALCRDSSGAPETWLRMLPGESRATSASVPAPPSP